jgi:hypothetical protein
MSGVDWFKGLLGVTSNQITDTSEKSSIVHDRDRAKLLVPSAWKAPTS